MKTQNSKPPLTKDELTDVLNDYPTKNDLKNELSNYPTKQDLKSELSNYPTKQDLKSELSNYPTKQDLKSELSNYPTKQDLKSELSNYPTKQDLKSELSKYATKQDLKKELSQQLTSAISAFRNEIDYKLLQMEERLTIKLINFQNIIMTARGPLLAELETRQQDREIETAQMEEVKGHIGNHEKRITKLEHS